MNSSNSDSTTTTTTSGAALAPTSTAPAALNELKSSQTFSTQAQQQHHQYHSLHHHHSQHQRNNNAPTPPSDLLYHHAGSGSSSSSISAVGIATTAATTTNNSNIGNNTFASINKMTATVDGSAGGGGSVNNTTIPPSSTNTTNVMGTTINNTSGGTTSSATTTSSSIHDYDNRQSLNNGSGSGNVGGGGCIAMSGGGGPVVLTGGNPTVGSGFSKPQERYVWEMRARSPNVTPASTVLNSPDLNTDMQYSIHPHQRQLQQIRVGRSPGSQFEQHNILPQGLASPGSPTDVGKADGHCLRDGEIVVFDDIDTNWMNKSNNSYSSNHSSGQHHRGDSFHANEDILKVTKMIGQLPIAEYEGSPRRFGNQQQGGGGGGGTQKSSGGVVTSNITSGGSILPKRPPGFPQRVSPMAVLTPQQQQQQHQEAAHARHQQMQQQHQFYAQATSSGSCSNASFFNNDTANNKSTGNLIDIDGDGGDMITSSTNQSQSSSHDSSKSKVKTPTFDYLYEFSETRKVLEDFFKGNNDDEKRFTDFTESGDDISCDTHHEYTSQFGQTTDEELHIEQSYIGQRLARIPKEELYMVHRSPKKQQKQMATTQQQQNEQHQHSQHSQHHQQQQLQQHNQHHQPCDNILYNDNNDIELYIDSNSRSSGDLADTELEANLRHHSRNFTLSPETTDYDSNCGDLDSLSNDINCTTDYGKLYTSMPVLEDGLSSGHASDTENNCQKYDSSNGGSGEGGSNSNNGSGHDGSHHDESVELSEKLQQQQQIEELLEQNKYNNSLKQQECMDNNCSANNLITNLVDVDDGDNVDEMMMGGGRHSGSGGIGSVGVGGLVGGLSGLCLSGDGDYKHQPQQQQTHCLDLINTSDNNCCNNDRSLYEPIYATVNKQHHLQQQQQQLQTQQQHQQSPPPPPAPQPHRPQLQQLQQQQQQSRHLKHPGRAESVEIQEAMKEIRSALQRAKTQPEKLKFCDEVLPPDPDSPIWVPRKNNEECNVGGGVTSDAGDIIGGSILDSNKVQCDDEEPDTDLETDRLLGQQRNDEQDFFDDKTIWPKTSCIGSAINSSDHSPTTSDIAKTLHVKPQFSSATIRQGIGTSLTTNSPEHCQMVGGTEIPMTTPEKITYTKSPTGSIKSLKDSANSDKKAKSRNKEGCFLDPAVLIEGVLFRARYLGSTQLVCEGQPTKSTRMMQAEEAVSRIKAPEGENQPSTEVDLFISTEKIMVLNTDLKEIMMDHALRTISYIADIGDLVVLMARRRFVHSDPCNSTGGGGGSGANADSSDIASTNGGGGTTNGKDKDSKENTTSTSSTSISSSSNNKHNRTPKMICHVFESDEAQFIAQSIGQAFQVAYMEFLKANGIENENLAKEMDYQEVLNSQEIFGDELEIFAKKELQKEVVVPKAKGEILGVVIVESGWGSMLPTVVIANLMSGGAAARCGQLNIGDQLIAINGLSLVGLPLSTCQNYIRNAKNQTAVKFTVVPCPPVVEVKILRPKALFQLGFSVQNGVICSLLRGGIAERGGVRVGHRIIEINNQSVVAVPHDTIVKLLSSSVGEILMKTMPTSMFRLLTGQETPIYI
ncbi:X11L isoform X1 [Musca autumnalis]|uniref:X11L isoform X1 n=1 Tax=Musca autumnalis TaxID=221902 RepID=UPI003CF1B771